MNLTAFLATIAILPAAINPSPSNAATGQGPITIGICGSGATITIPSGSGGTPSSGNSPCCAKACHGSSRKRGERADAIDSSQ